MLTTIWEPHFYRFNTGLPPMPAVHCRRANAGTAAGLACGRHEERQRRNAATVVRVFSEAVNELWKDTVNELWKDTKDGSILASSLRRWQGDRAQVMLRSVSDETQQRSFEFSRRR